ncbi:MAG TPA: tetratricopeptide repeat protein [Herpetosiphonaceae bacterium]
MTGEAFGQWVRRCRKAWDLTQAELAQRVGCAEITIRKIEANEVRPSRHFINRLADQLKIAPDERPAFIAAGRGQPQRQFNNLLAPPNPLIGRAREVAAACHRLRDPGVRLLTLTGPGGAGKTRLGIQIAAELLDDFRDGVCFVALATIDDDSLVASTIAQALDLSEAGGQPIDELLSSYLRDKQMLLVLDNFEQVVAAAPVIAGLLAHARQLKLLVTSRVVLHLSGEHELPVPPLALPDAQALPPVDVLSQYAAVALFVDRARAVSPRFSLTPANATAVAQICTRLDGLPLAIELAAAWIKLLTPQALLAKLEQRLSLLTGGARDLPARQQTLRDAIAWSYNLLEPDAQALFRRLGVFVAGCTLEAVEAICAADTDRAPTTEREAVLRGLLSLIDQSLLRRVEATDGTVRFAMLETLREFALECIAAAGELNLLRQRHARYFLALAEAAGPHLQDTEQEAWLDRLEAEHENLRAALDWCCGPSGDAEAAWSLVELLWEFWLVRGYISEGRAWIATVQALPTTSRPTLARVRALCGGGRLAWAQNDWRQATLLLEASLAISRELGDTAASACTLNYLGQVAEAQGAYDRAATLFDESLALFQELGDHEGSATALTSRAQIAQAQGDYLYALALLERSLALFQELGDRRGCAVAMTVQGQVRHAQAAYTHAVELFEAGLTLFQSLGYRHGMAWALTNLGQAVLAQGAYDRAATLFDESLALFQELGDRRGYAWALTNQGQAARAQGDERRAVTLLERSLALFQELNDRRGYAWALLYRGHVAQAQAAYHAAARYFADSLGLFRALDDAWYCVECLTGLAAAFVELDRPVVAARLCAAVAALRATGDHQDLPAEHSGTLAALRLMLDDATFAQASSAGSALTLDQAIDEALELERMVGGAAPVGHSVIDQHAWLPD